MEKYTIRIGNLQNAIIIHREMLEDALNDKSCTAKELAEYKESFEFFNNLSEEVEVSTLEEYFSLIDTIREYTSGDYELYNGGRTIELY